MERNIIINSADQMTPYERRQAIQAGKEADRVLCVPFMSELKCRVSGSSVWDFWHDAEKMAETEILVFNRFGHDRMTIGPNSRGITEALGGESVYPENGVPYMEEIFLTDHRKLETLEPPTASHPRLQTFSHAAELLSSAAYGIVPMEASIGGPFTIASNLRGVENLLRDCRKAPEFVHRLMRLVTDTQKNCISELAKYQMGIAMADPVANPALIGPKFYETFVYPYTKELTDYAYEKTAQKVSLHMCGKTYRIWDYLKTYQLNELSLDNIIDLEQAAEELGNFIPIAGNVDPVEIVMNGTKEEIVNAVHSCISSGSKSRNGYTLTTGCDLPHTTEFQKIDWFMEAARTFKYSGRE
ncbi:MAG: uroporphyrinogen decarboxylase family protein [Lachnospiraceae bacterium]|nr:uroporphyrinogen decarboxylase family protein [Lachnospiraceae bacterium]